MKRRLPPALDSERRASSNDIVEINYSESEARKQASRCLRCNVNTIFDTSICVACNGCVDVCPKSNQLVGPDQVRAQIPDADRVGFAGITDDDLAGYSDLELNELGGIMIKDESTCIRCAMCASRCPTNAILMKRFEFSRECVTIHARNPKIRYADAV